MRAKRVREPYKLMILDQGENAGDLRWCVVAFDVNDHQIGRIQGNDWREMPPKHPLPPGNKTIFLERPIPKGDTK